MNYSKVYPKLLVVLAFLALAGCASNRGVVNLQLNQPEVRAAANGQKVMIVSVSDQRRFEENPSRQDIPSLGFGGTEQSSDEIRKRAIGRKRNTYGKALGDILLPEGETVETVIYSALERSFVEMGYEVVAPSKSQPSDAIVVRARIKQFWAYMTPGFWSIKLASDIDTDLQVTLPEMGGEKDLEVKASSADNFQTASGSNWKKVMQDSLGNYVAEVKKDFPNEFR